MTRRGVWPRAAAMVLLAMFLSPDRSSVGSNQDILRRADQARGNLEGITWDVTLRQEGGKGNDPMTFGVKARGFDILAENTYPPRYRGNKVLMLNGNMWFHRPDISKPVPISQRQKLQGNAAYGDIASTNYANDYEATLLGEEPINGESCYVFDLLAKDKKATYDRIKYWISKQREVGVKAEYFTVSGKLFKAATMHYDNNIKIGETTRPFISKILMYDELMSSDVTVMAFKNTGFQKLPDYIFNLNLLRK